MSATLSPEHFIGQTVLNLVRYELKRGQWRRCRALGVPDEILSKINTMSHDELDKLTFSSLPWFHIKVDEAVFWRLTSQTGDCLQNEIARAIKLGASSEIMRKRYKLSHQETAQRRIIMGLDKRDKGRARLLTDQQKAESWVSWHNRVGNKPKVPDYEAWKHLMDIAEELSLPLTALWNELREWGYAPQLTGEKDERTLKK